MSLEQRRERIRLAHWTGLRNRIRDEWRQSEERADQLLAEWEQEASNRGLARDSQGYWAEAEQWIRERVGR